ncbi:hypothetical protein, partial [Streptomyces palmae]
MAVTILLAPLSVVAAWVDSEISDTDRYVETVAPIAREPAVRKALVDRLADRVVRNDDAKEIASALAEALRRSGAPPAMVHQAGSLSEVLESGATTSHTQGSVAEVVVSDQFAQEWADANRRNHTAVARVLTGKDSSVVEGHGGAITLDLGPVLEEVKKRLVDAGFQGAARMPYVDRSVVLVKTGNLDRAQRLLRVLALLGPWLPLAVVLLGALAVWTLPAHRIALMTAGAGVGAMMVALLVALGVLRRTLLDSVPRDALPRDAAAVVYDTCVRFLSGSTRAVLLIAAAVVVAGYLVGPGRGARALRRTAHRGTEAAGRALARAGLRPRGPGDWLAGHRRQAAGAVGVLTVLTLLQWTYPTPGSVALVLGAAVAALAALAVLAAAGSTAGEPVAPRPGAIESPPDRPTAPSAGAAGEG